MAKPIKFKESNFTWKGWPKSETKLEVRDLPAYKTEDRTISCWKLTWEERLISFFTGKVWLHVVGRHIPVYIDGRSPFFKG